MGIIKVLGILYLISIFISLIKAIFVIAKDIKGNYIKVLSKDFFLRVLGNLIFVILVPMALTLQFCLEED